jgi:hypothetical protein
VLKSWLSGATARELAHHHRSCTPRGGIVAIARRHQSASRSGQQTPDELIADITEGFCHWLIGSGSIQSPATSHGASGFRIESGLGYR